MSILLLLVSGLAIGTQADPEPAAQDRQSHDGPLGPDRGLDLQGAIELIDNRTQFSKTWVLENGTYLSRISQSPLHYIDAQGAWKDIDPTILPVTQLDLGHVPGLSLYGNTKNALQSHYGLDGSVTITHDDARATWTPRRLAVHDASDTLLAAQNTLGVTPMADGNKVSWPGLFPEATDRYTVERGLVKHDLVLHEPLLQGDPEDNNENGTFALEGTLELSQGLLVFSDGEEKTEDFLTQGGIHFFNPDGTLAFTMGSVYAYDASIGQEGDDNEENDGPSMQSRSWIDGRTRVRFTDDGLVVSLEVPSDWIHSESREYPVTIDPTWGWDDVDASIYVREGEGNQNSVSMLYSGATTHWDWGCFCDIGKANRIFLRQGLSAIDNRIISVNQARLDQYVETTDGVHHEARFVSSDSWSPTTLTWSSQPGASTSIGSILPTTTGWKTVFAPTNIVESQISGYHVQKFFGDDQFSYRFHRTSGEFGNTENYMRIYRTGNLAPEWFVSYQIDSTPPSTSVSLSGTSGANGWHRSSVSVSMSCSDSGAGCHQTIFRVDGGSYQTYSGSFSVSKQGTTDIRYRSQDKVLNWENLKNEQFKIDTVAPSTSNSLSGTLGNNGWYRSSVGVSLACTDATSGCMTTQYRVNGGSWQSGSSLTLSSPGVYTVEYHSQDQAGNWESTKARQVKIDMVPPNASHSLGGTLGSNGWYRSPVAVSLSATDAHSGVSSIQYRLNGGSWQTYSGSFTVGSQGVTTLDYRATDNAGNIRTVTGPSIKIDTAPPSTSSSLSGTLGSNGWYRSNVGISLSCTDATSGCMTTQYRINGGSWQSGASLTLGASGVYTVDYRSQDQAGNWEGINSRQVKIDQTLPAVSHSLSGTLGSNGWHRSPVTVSLSATDAHSGVSSIQYRLNGGSWQAYSGAFTVGSQGVTTLDYRATDHAGNTRTVTGSSFKIDTTHPATELNLDGTGVSNGWYRSDVEVTLTCSDATSGCANTEHRIDGGTWQTYSGSFTMSTQGVQTLDYRSIDTAGNIETIQSKTIRIDTVNPVASHSLSGTLGSNGWYLTDVEVALSCSDATSGCNTIEYQLDAGPWTPYSGVFTVDAEGITTLDYRATDMADNTQTVNGAPVKIDTSVPSTTLTLDAPPNAAGWHQTGVEVTLSCSDATSGCDTTAYRFDGGTWQTYSGSFTMSTEGIETLEYRSVDVAKNIENIQSQTIRIDTVNPVASHSFSGSLGSNGWYQSDVEVALSCADATSGCDSIEYQLDAGSWTPYSGAFTVDAEGITTLDYRATDMADNTQTVTGATVKIDTSAPTTTLTLDAPPNAAGWHQTSVEVTLTCADATSGCSATEHRIAGGTWQSGSSLTLNSEGIHTLDYRSIDAAGNLEDIQSQTIRIDTVNPVASHSFSGTLGSDGWYQSDVEVALSCADATSGCDSIEYQLDAGSWTPYSGAFIVNSQGITTLDYRATDIADNTHSVTGNTVKIDTSAPTTTLTLDAPPNAAGWHQTSVEVTLSCADATSGCSATEHRIAGGSWQSGSSLTLNTEGIHTLDYRSIDVAGNVEGPQSQIVRIDTTAPVLESNRAPAANGNGWNNEEVTVSFTCTDAISGVDTVTGPVTLTSDGAGQSVTGDCEDGAGNSATETVSDINIDTQAPTIAMDTRTPANANGWNNEDVTVQWTCTDTLSGPLTPTISDTITSEGFGQSTTATCEDQAGNTASNTVGDIHIDKTPPTINGDRAPAANSNGWNNEDVTATFTCDDGLSGVDTVTGSQTLTSEGAGQTVSGSCEDLAGNSATQTVSDINIDKTAPMINGDRTPLANENGWNNEDVTVSFTCDDSLSGVDTVTGSQTLTNEGTGQSATGTCEDLAGNSATQTVSDINIDKTAPTMSGDRTPSPNANGWNNEDVTVSFTCDDSLSGIDSSTGSTTLTNEGSGQTVTGSCEDLAGNSATHTVSNINIDKTAPSLSGDRTPSPNTNGWNNDDVTVSFTCDDNLSGIDTVTSSQTLTSEGTGQSATGTCEDLAGNSASSTVGGINIDKTAPVTTFESRTPANANGWNKEDVTVQWSCSDSLSGPVDPSISKTRSDNGADQSATATCTDLADNGAAHTVGDINIDKIAPQITLATRTPANLHGWNNQDVTVQWDCADTLSGPLETTVSDTITAEGENHEAEGTCEDLAGNTIITTLGDIHIDKTDPVIEVDSRTPANIHGWNNQDVTVTFTCSDPLAGVDTLTGPQTLTSEAAGQSTTGTCQDLAGNSASITEHDIHIDKTAPVIEGVPTPAPNEHGWNNEDVTVSFTCNDPLSGVDTHTGPTNLTSEGAGQSVTGSCQDLAGNTASTLVDDIHIDKSAPAIMFELRTPPTMNGWNNDDVTALWTCDDEFSGPVDSSISVTLSDDGEDQTATGTCEDLAGNTASHSMGGIHIDQTRPEIQGERTPLANAHGWNNETVTVSYSCNDALSGVQTLTDPTSLSEDGADQYAIGTCMDMAGNTADTTVDEIHIDTTAPVIVGDRTPQANENGWNNEDVTVSFTCSDTLAGVATQSDPITLSTEGENQSATGTCQDKAGNTAQDTVGDIHIDKTPPTSQYALAGSEGDDDWFLSTVNVTLTANDTLSGASFIEYRLDEGPWVLFNGTFMVHDEGNTTLEMRATDLADNVEDAAIVQIFIDTTPPMTTLNPGLPFAQINDTRFVTSDTPFTLEASDATSGVAYRQYTINGGDNWTTLSEFNLTGEDGPKVIGYRSKDMAGNQEETRFYEVTLDNQAPDSAHGYNGTAFTRDNLTFLGPATLIEINATDASEVATIMNRTDSDAFGDYADPFPLTGADGNQTLEYFAVDVLGNTETPQTHSLFLDATSPSTKLHVGEPAWEDNNGDVWVTSGTLLSLTSEDPMQGGNASGVAMVEYRLGDGNWTPYEQPFTLPTTQASWNVTYRATDNVGNLEAPKNATFLMDDQAPEVDLLQPAPGSLTTTQGYFDPAPDLDLPVGPDYAYATEGSEVLIDVYAMDLGLKASGVQNVTLWVEGELIETMTQEPYQGSWNTTGLPLGEYEIEAVATDMLGNKNIAAVTIFLLPATTDGALSTVSELAGG